MGYAHWKRLHRLAYVAPMLGVIHFTWRVKKDVSEPLTYAVVLGAFLLVRVEQKRTGIDRNSRTA